VLIARSATSDGLMIYDARRRPRLELEIAVESGFESRAGQEYPAAGLRVLRVWEAGTDSDALQAHDLREQAFVLPPRC
jgi:hypothetical protein